MPGPTPELPVLRSGRRRLWTLWLQHGPQCAWGLGVYSCCCPGWTEMPLSALPVPGAQACRPPSPRDRAVFLLIGLVWKPKLECRDRGGGWRGETCLLAACPLFSAFSLCSVSLVFILAEVREWGSSNTHEPVVTQSHVQSVRLRRVQLQARGPSSLLLSLLNKEEEEHPPCRIFM